LDGFICLSSPCAPDALESLDLIRLGASAFLAILFLQSGLDKVVDRAGNVEWLTGHFANSPLASQVKPMLSVITLVELAAGALCAFGAVWFLFTGSSVVAAYGALVAMVGLVMLFLGQRLAKDYEGAAVLVPYFLLASGSLWVLGS